MAIKGSATIELTNADGSKQIVKHDNMITDAVNDMLTSFRGEMPLVMRLASTGDSFVKHLFGGIMLFNEKLSDDPADYAINTTKITGYASHDAYGGTDVSRGACNQAESGVQEDGSYKMVFDFSTSQGNGTIQSLGLCPNVIGKVGATDTKDSSSIMYIKYETDTPNPFNSYGRLLPDGGSTAGISNWSFRIAAIIGDIAYAVAYYNVYNNNDSSSLMKNGGILKLYKFKLGAFSVGLNNNIGRATYLECVDVQLPEDFINTLHTSSSTFSISYYFDVYNKKLIVFPCAIKTDVPVNGTVMYLEIDLANYMAITKHTFTNTTAGVLKAGYNYKGFRESHYSDHVLYILKEYIVLVTKVSDKARMYVISRSDNAKVVEAKLAGEPFEPFRLDSWGFGIAPIFVSDNILIFGRQYDSNYYEYFYMIDLRTGEVKETNCSDFYAYATVSFGNIACVAAVDTYLSYKTRLNPFILTTKNNLDTPVVKTASQTMKITYTLTESEGA
jgi:hypothetical protein